MRITNHLKWAAFSLLIAAGYAAIAEAGGPSRGGMKFGMSGGGRSMSSGAGKSISSSMRSRGISSMSQSGGNSRKLNMLPPNISNRAISSRGISPGLHKNFKPNVVKKLPSGIKLDLQHGSRQGITINRRPKIALPSVGKLPQHLAGRSKISAVAKIGKLSGGIKLSDIKHVKNFNHGIKISDIIKQPKYPGPYQPLPFPIGPIASPWDKHHNNHWWKLLYLSHHHHHAPGFWGSPFARKCRPYPYPVPVGVGNVTVIQSTQVVTLPPPAEIDPETPVATVAGVDLHILDVEQLSPGSKEDQTGPKYRISVQNQGDQPVTTPVQLALLAGQDATMQPSETALVELKTLAAGATSTMDVELPYSVLQLPQADGTQPTEYRVLLVFIDSGKELEESDEDNNAVILDRIEALAAN